MSVRARLALAFDHDVLLGTLLERLAAIHGDAPLVAEHPDGDGPPLRLSYQQGADLVARWAGGVRTRIAPGDRVVVHTPNGYSLFLLCLAVSRAGGVPVPVNPRMRPAEIDHVVADCGAAVVLRSVDELPAAAPVEAAPASPLDLAAILYTSGTTGRPKGAELTHRALVGVATSGSLWPAHLRRDEAVSGMPVAHIAGFSMLVMLAAIGIPVYLLRHFRPTDALDAIEERRATLFVGVPAMYRMMLEAGAEERDLSSVRMWASGADVMPFDLARRFQRFGATLRLPLVHRPVGHAGFVDGYGMVELGGGAAIKVSPPGLPLALAGLLTVPLPRFRLRVVDDDGRPVERGEVGELVVRGPGMMRGYHGRIAETSEAMTPDGWLRTGDLARRRALGLFEFVGRKKDVIKHGGYSVFPAEVEEVLARHPAVAEAAVLGLPDVRKGEVPAAVVTLRPGAAVETGDLLRWAGEELADYKVPTRALVVEDLPRTGTDKVAKTELRALFADT